MVYDLYKELYQLYGQQGWWPLLIRENSNEVKLEYRQGDYNSPRNEDELFEICVGAILTQNTSWKNVERSMIKLFENNLLSARKILEVDDDFLKELIRSSGYFNQKAIKLKRFSEFFLNLNGCVPRREDLLNVWGIGPETADCILLYGYKIPVFVVDAYTKRILKQRGIIKGDESYDKIQELFHKSLPKDHTIYEEFHALLVEHGKNIRV